MKLPPAVIVHGLDDARLALSQALPVTLLSAPWAGVYGGVGWWRALLEAAEAPAAVINILDCGDSPGRALSALRGGQRHLVLRAPPAVLAGITARGGMVLPEPPAALDLGVPGGARRLAAWLAHAP